LTWTLIYEKEPKMEEVGKVFCARYEYFADGLYVVGNSRRPATALEQENLARVAAYYDSARQYAAANSRRLIDNALLRHKSPGRKEKGTHFIFVEVDAATILNGSES
jgi:hypothetical protein